jgi:YVTN family beta-propeller protein
VVDLKDLTSVATVEGFNSPRFILEIYENKAYVSDLYSDDISIVDTKNFKITGKINLGSSSEQMVLVNNLVFVAFWSKYSFPDLENNLVFVLDPANDFVIDTIEVGKEPNSVVVDKNMKIWVLCSGGFLNEEIPTLWQIDPVTFEASKSLSFDNIESSPSSLCMNGSRDTLYFINNGIFKMAISAASVPVQPFILENRHLFYALAVDPESSVIFASDAIDYQQSGLILRYKPDGTLIDTFRAGIIPGRFVFL